MMITVPCSPQQVDLLIEIGGKKDGCHDVTDDQYENIGRYKKYLEDSTGNDYDIDCSSKFVTFSLFALLALLF